MVIFALLTLSSWFPGVVSTVLIKVSGLFLVSAVMILIFLTRLTVIDSIFIYTNSGTLYMRMLLFICWAKLMVLSWELRPVSHC